MKHTATLSLLACSVLLSACAVLEGDKIDYKSAGKAPSLDVPPDLSQLTRDTRYALPGAPVTASGQQAARAGAAAGVPTATASVGDFRIERAGNQRWLVVNRPAEQLWGPLREFWRENGFLLALDQADLGIMETDWAENRAKLPQDAIRATLGRIFDSLYSTSERDRFRTRLERTASGGTEIYVSHRGMVEVLTRTAGSRDADGTTVWQSRPADPELETEFLRRMMVKLGVPQEQAKAAAASDVAKPTARVARAGDIPVVEIDEGFDRAWRRVGLSLDRTGFTVEDRDRAQGLYFVRYVEPASGKQDPGFFARLFGSSDKAAPPLKLRIALRSEGNATTVSVLDAGGTAATSATAQRIVQVLADDLK